VIDLLWLVPSFQEVSMIRFFQGRDRHRFGRDTDQMFRLRARQFHDRLNWDVAVRDGWEIDEFDGMNPLYLVSRAEGGDVAGTLRFLPTTGPTMLRDVFDRYFDPPFAVESPLVWECTRLAIEPAIAARWMTPTGLCRTTFELMQGGCEVAMMAGIAQILGIFDRSMIRIYRRVGWVPDIVARSESTGLPGAIYLGLWDVSDANLSAMRERSGLGESVLEPSPSFHARAVA
jgi:N-acyl-L-homoserine lactone synthetase